jgi:ribosome-associated translation inhibitor RaiA
MKVPLQITFRQLAPSPALTRRIQGLAARLERFSRHIMRCHVIVAPPPRHRRHGSLFAFHIDITLPDRGIAIRRAHPADHAHEDPYVALRDAFSAARRRLENYERTRRGDLKRHSGARATIRGRASPEI